MPRFDTIIFDLDGTLTDSAPGIINSIKYASAKLGYRELTAPELRSCVGPPLAEHIMGILGLSQEESLEFLKAYREYFAQKGIYENNVYHNVPAMLAEVREMGVRLMLCTGKPEPYAREVLRYFELLDYFEDVLGPTFEGKYNDKAEGLAELLRRSHAVNCVMAGDRKYDIIAAKANGVASVGVLWGYGSREELKASGADYILDSPKQLVELIRDSQTAVF